MPPRLERHPRIARRLADLPRRSHRRIVSLVPSLSEALARLGLRDRLVGVTAYCVLPPAAFEGLARVGGTKDADVAAIAALEPDLVIANQEENTARVVRRLADAGIDVWVTYPRKVRAGFELLAELAGLGAQPEIAAAVLEPVRSAVDAAEAERVRSRAAGRRPVRVFCAIWRDPWMTVGVDTYIHDLIELCGGTNVFADACGMARSAAGDAPGRAAGARRYPIVERAAIEAAAPEVILLPSEPFAFTEADRAELLALACPAATNGRVHLIDGTLVSWYGPRIAESIRVLGPLLANS